MPNNFFGNAPNHAMPYDSVTYNGGTVPVTAGYHLVKRGSYGSIDFNTDKCVVDFDAGCTFTNILISGDQVTLNFGPKTTLLANVDGGTLAITGDRNYVYFGPDSSIKDNGAPNARNNTPDGNGMAVSVRGKYNTVEAANWTTLFEGPHSAAAAYNSSGTAKHNTFKHMKGRNVANNGSYVSSADFHASAPHTTFYNCLADYASPGASNTETGGGYKHGSWKLGPIAGTGSPSDGNGNGYGSKILYCYGDISGNSPYGSSTDLPTGSSANNDFGIQNYGAPNSQVIGTYLDSDNNQGSLGMYEPYTLMFGNIWAGAANLYQESTGTATANIVDDISSGSSGTHTDNVEHGGNTTALAND